MLAARSRIRRPADFKRIFRSGVKAGSRCVVIHADDLDTAHAPRVGFIVSKAVGTAVVRNRVKRRLRAICAQRMAQLRGDLVIRALPAAAGASSAELDACVTKALGRIYAD